MKLVMNDYTASTTQLQERGILARVMILETPNVSKRRHIEAYWGIAECL